VAIVVLGNVCYESVVPWPHAGQAWGLLAVVIWTVVATVSSIHPPERFSQFVGVDDAVEPVLRGWAAIGSISVRLCGTT
jgi:hypothetical protein